jgi:Domain of Unknown Function (DUF1206)
MTRSLVRSGPLPDPDRVERRARHSGTFAWLIRVGLAGYGLLHLLVAWLSVRVVLGSRSGAGGRGALADLGDQASGLVAVIVLAGGLAVLAVWQAFAAAVGYRQDHGIHRTLARLAAGWRAGTYAYLAYSTFRISLTGGSAAGSSARSASAGVLAQPLGRIVLGAGGAIIVGVGAGLIVFGARRGFLDQLDDEARNSGRRVPIVTLGQVGYAAKGIAFAVVGLLVFWAAVTNDPRKTGGLDQSLERLTGAHWGSVAVVLVGTGIGSFGLYLIARAWHLRLSTLTS